MSKFIKNWLPVLIWVGLIFFLSNQPGLKSGLPNSWDFCFRKLAHIVEYAILTWLLARALLNYKLNAKKALLLALALSVAYAISDEYHQSFVNDRVGVYQDVLIDSLGILAVIGLYFKKMIKYI